MGLFGLGLNEGDMVEGCIFLEQFHRQNLQMIVAVLVTCKDRMHLYKYYDVINMMNCYFNEDFSSDIRSLVTLKKLSCKSTGE